MVDLKRRDMMKGAAFLAALGIRPARGQETAGDVPPEGMDRLQAVMERHDVTILGDTNHRQDVQIYGLLSDPKFLDAAQAANVGTIAVEVPSYLQDKADNLAAGRIGREGFGNGMTMGGYQPLWQGEDPSRFLDTIANAVQQTHDRGIRLVFADNPAGPAQTKVLEFENRHSAEFMRLGTTKGEEHRVLTDQFEKKYGTEFIGLMTDFFEDRYTPQFNKNLETAIGTMAVPNRRIVVMYGMEHAEPLLQAFSADRKSAAIVAIHLDKPSLDENTRSYAAPSAHSLDYTRTNNFLVSTGRFADDPTPGSGPAIASPRTPAAPMNRRPVASPRKPR